MQAYELRSWWGVAWQTRASLLHLCCAFVMMLMAQLNVASAQDFETYLIEKSDQGTLPICVNGPIQKGFAPFWWGHVSVPEFNAARVAEILTEKNKEHCSTQKPGITYLRSKSDDEFGFGSCNFASACVDLVKMTRQYDNIEARGNFCLYKLEPSNLYTVWECEQPDVYAYTEKNAKLTYLRTLDSMIGQPAYAGSAYKIVGFALTDRVFWGLSASTRAEFSNLDQLKEIGVSVETCPQNVRLALLNETKGASGKIVGIGDYTMIFATTERRTSDENECNIILGSQFNCVFKLCLNFSDVSTEKLSAASWFFDTALWLQNNIGFGSLVAEADNFTDELTLSNFSSYSLNNTPRSTGEYSTIFLSAIFNFTVKKAEISDWGFNIYLHSDEMDTEAVRVLVRPVNQDEIFALNLNNGFISSGLESANFMKVIEDKCAGGIFVRLEDVNGDRFDSEFHCKSNRNFKVLNSLIRLWHRL